MLAFLNKCYSEGLISDDLDGTLLTQNITAVSYTHLIVGNKENLLHELDQFSVNKASLFPEIDDVAEYIKLKYNGSDK